MSKQKAWRIFIAVSCILGFINGIGMFMRYNYPAIHRVAANSVPVAEVSQTMITGLRIQAWWIEKYHSDFGKLGVKIGEEYVFHDAKTIRESEKALLVEVRFNQIWVPKSVIVK